MQTSGGESKRTAFEAEALPHMQRLYGAALRWTRKPEDASDLVQETYLRAYRTFDGFTPGTNCKAWLFTILYSVFVNRHHHDERRPRTVSVEDLENVLPWPEGESEREIAILRERDPWAGSEKAREALDRLPAPYRVAVELVDVEELSYEEAAAALDCPIGTLRSRLFRARRLLYEELKEHARKAGYLPSEVTP
jgi:RNA polymerase sigma-70 factor, ECF subfamily